MYASGSLVLYVLLPSGYLLWYSTYGPGIQYLASFCHRALHLRTLAQLLSGPGAVATLSIALVSALISVLVLFPLDNIIVDSTLVGVF